MAKHRKTSLDAERPWQFGNCLVLDIGSRAFVYARIGNDLIVHYEGAPRRPLAWTRVHDVVYVPEGRAWGFREDGTRWGRRESACPPTLRETAAEALDWMTQKRLRLVEDFRLTDDLKREWLVKMDYVLETGQPFPGESVVEIL